VAKSRAKAVGGAGPGRGVLPSTAELLAFIRASPTAVGKREIARAFDVAPSDRSELRNMLRQIERAGAVTRAPNRRLIAAALPPEVAAIERFGSDEDGIALARPVAWKGPGEPPVLRLLEAGADESLAVGERALARLTPRETGDIEARIIRRLAPVGERIVGIYERTREGSRLTPVDRRDRNEYRIAQHDMGGARDGELVVAEQLSGARLGAPRVRVRERLGPVSNPGAISLLAIAAYDIPTEFPAEVIAEAEAALAITPERLAPDCRNRRCCLVCAPRQRAGP
jgi:ribonuclease R